eukprot:3857541-Alexandrium_andersonii.AAC.1
MSCTCPCTAAHQATSRSLGAFSGSSKSIQAGSGEARNDLSAPESGRDCPKQPPGASGEEP